MSGVTCFFVLVNSLSIALVAKKIDKFPALPYNQIVSVHNGAVSTPISDHIAACVYGLNHLTEY